MSDFIYKFASGRCPEHDRQNVIRVSFSVLDEVGLDGSEYKKEECLCALAKDEGCTDPNQCPIFLYAEFTGELSI